MIQYNFFHRNFVLRLSSQFMRPPLPVVTRFELPSMAMVHYINPSETNPWPSEDLLFYNNNPKPLRIIHHTELAELKGSPRLIAGDALSKIREFRTSHPRFRLAVDIESMKREPRTIITHNYGLLLSRYKYQRGLFTFHNRWHNIFATLFLSIGENVNTGYHQYVELRIPEQLPSRSVLDKSVSGWTTRNMGVFNSFELIFLHHLWVWMGERRENGLMHKYIPDMTGVKVVLREGDRFTVIDLSLLEEWRKPSAIEKKRHEEAKAVSGGVNVFPLKKGTFSPSELQRVFLRMLMAVTEVRNNDLPESLGGDDVSSVREAIQSDGTADAGSEAEENGADTTVTSQDQELTEESAYAGYNEEADKLNLLAEIDKDIEALEITGLGEGDELLDPESGIGDTSVDVDSSSDADAFDFESESKVKGLTFFPTNNTEAFQTLLDRAAETGSITAAEYRRLTDSREHFNDLPAPLDQEGDMREFVKVAPELIKIDKAPMIPDHPTILDKSMLSSSLLHYNERYARNVMQRDIAGMVSQLQSAGVMVTNYDVEEVEDITGAHYKYTIQVKPIEGASSTLSMKIPKVDDEGNFQINNVRFRTRSQRGDLPIRKISPEEVALTSYYGKVFVERGQRRVNDWGKWVRNAIMARGLSASNTAVTGMVPGSGFDRGVEVPRTISAIAMGFREFKLAVEDKVFTCSFDMKKMQIEKTPTRMVHLGKNEDGAELLCGFDENLYIVENGQMREAPSLETILGLDARKSPVEFAELKVFGKMIPTGVVLGYLLGFENLIQMVNAPSMRTVPVGKRTGLVDDEWAINFDDKTYVFSRRDRYATMILGGWREFSETTTRFPSTEFNKKDVYFNLFEEKKLGVRYLRELDLLEQMFVDPITRELLVEMGEPVVFTKLLLRSCELLCDDKHPDSQDTRYMRCKGYERFAGVVYSELVRSLRIHNGRPGKHRYGIELNPYAVWIGIQQDPAKDQVSEINPIQNLKETEAVTYSGTGGRSTRSMVKSARIYHENDMGVISESTVDSSDVAINVFTSANPQFTSLRGTTRAFNPEEHGPTSLLSTTALLSPGSTKDDPKRVKKLPLPL